jgi:acyl-CoA thioester hydrolase
MPDLDAPVFEGFVRVRFNEVDPLGHVNNAVYLIYLEQAAIDHAEAAGLDAERLTAFGGAFVAHRHQIVYLRPAHAGDILRILTWLDEPLGARVTRHYLVVRVEQTPAMASILGRLRRGGEISGVETLVAQASTEWVFTNERGRPKRIPADLMRLFLEPAAS